MPIKKKKPDSDVHDAMEQMRRSILGSRSFLISIYGVSDTTTDVDGHEMKAGDTVEVLPGSLLVGSSGVNAGDVLTIHHIDSDGDAWFDCPNGGTYYSRSEHVRLASKGAKYTPTRASLGTGQFKVGDRVRIKQGVTAYVYTTPGKTGVIEDHSSPIFPRGVKVRFDQGQGHVLEGSYYIDPNDLELIDPSQTSTPHPTPDSDKAYDADGKELKAGQWVEILVSNELKGQVLKVVKIDGRSVLTDAPDYPGDEDKLLCFRGPEVRITTKPEKPKVSMDSVILSADKKETILAALSQVEHHDKIFDRWGFDQVFEKGTAVSLLFWGVPGTGKTLMAQAIADQLNAKLKVIGAAEIETAEPGGAERNIQKIFAEANEANKDGVTQVILFDECDSLLMDRNKVGPIIGATINCLLTEIERYTGVVIFTTNRLGQLDAALERRISAKVEFPFPDRAQREQIWRRMIPKKAPLDKDVDLAALAELRLAGGNIKNAVLTAARTAAHAKQKKITQANLLDAARAEVSSLEQFRRQIEAQDQTRPLAQMTATRTGYEVERQSRDQAFENLSQTEYGQEVKQQLEDTETKLRLAAIGIKGRVN